LGVDSITTRPRTRLAQTQPPDTLPPAIPFAASAWPDLPNLPPAPLVPARKQPRRSVPPLPREYLRPTFAQSFHCISSACEDTCCQGWSLPIDQATYQKYGSVASLKPLLGTLIVLNTSHQTPSDYARIPQTATGTCPMLEKENLCAIHKQHGPEMLPATCATYPRAVSTYSGQVEQALNLSCPEAARVTLLHPRLLGPIVSHPNSGLRQRTLDPGRYAAYQPAPSSSGRLPGLLPALLCDDPSLAIREFVLLLLSDRGYPLWQRLYLTGILARRLDASRAQTSVAEWSAANPAAVSKILSDSARALVLERLRPAMNGIKAQPGQQLQLLMELLRLRISQPPVSTRFIECVQDFECGLGCATAKSEQQILAAYAEGYQRWYLPLMKRHPQILENYLANYVFKNHYPFGRPRHTPLAPADTLDAQSEHLLLCAHAGLAQMLLIGIARHHGEGFSVAHVVKLMQSLARTIEHSPQFLDRITLFLRQKNLVNLRGIALLLRHDS
jgi:lysine-N-methylase